MSMPKRLTHRAFFVAKVQVSRKRRINMYDLRNEKIKRRVVIYARVSTEHEAQLYALDNQIDWYKSILNDHPEWTLVEQYIDEGITGTSAKKRPKFMKMIRDAKKHKFDAK